MTENSTKPIRVLLVDDHKALLWGLVKLIEGERPRMEVAGTATSCAEALLSASREQPDVILLDIDLGGDSSLDLLPEMLKETKAQVLILTGIRDAEAHDQAIRNGARGVVLKEEPAEVILKAIEKVHEGQIWLDRAATGRVFSQLSKPDEQEDADPESSKLARLTPREREIIKVITTRSYSTNKKIAEQLNISESTLRNHLTAIYSKLGVTNRLELFMYALRHGLAQQSD